MEYRSIIEESELFDENFYIEHYRDVRMSDELPFEHFVNHGLKEDRKPNEWFDPVWYKEYYEDIQGSDIYPFIHYILYGKDEGRFRNKEEKKFASDIKTIEDHFDKKWYSEIYNVYDIDPVEHFLRWGWKEGKNPNPEFDVFWYLEEYPDVKESGMNLFVHYILYGKDEGRFSNKNIKELNFLKKDLIQKEDKSHIYMDLFDNTKIDNEDYLYLISHCKLDSEKIKQLRMHNNIKLVSFDIWDTILRRKCHPDEVKLASARFLFLNYSKYLKRIYKDDMISLSKLRRKSEDMSSLTNDFEYRYREAIDLWLLQVLQKGVSKKIFQNAKKDLLEHEENMELRCIYKDSSMIDILQNIKDKNKIFISDFYMGEQFISKLLKTENLNHFFTKGYVSCDYIKNKRNGDLFEHVLDDFEISTNEMFHIGDNKIADIDIPSQKNILTFHYESKKHLNAKNWLEKAFYDKIDGDNSLHGKRILQLVQIYSESIDTNSYKRIGVKLAPIAIGFVLDIIEEALRLGVKTVYFLTREGIFLKELYDMVIKYDPYLSNYPKSELLEVSRIATFAPSLEKVDVENLMRLWNQYSVQSPEAFCKTLNIDSNDTKKLFEKHGFSYDKEIVYPWENSSFVQILASKEFQNILEGTVGLQRKLLKKYLIQKGMNGGQPVSMIVDLGWRGTIQDNLAQLVTEKVHGCYLGLFQYLNPQVNVSKKGWLFNNNIKSDDWKHWEVGPIEMLFNALGGSVTGYKQDKNGNVKAIKKKEKEEDKVFEQYTYHFQKGIKDVLPELIEYVALHALTADDLKPISRDLLKNLITNPPTEIAEAFFDLTHNETFGTGKYQKMHSIEGLLKGIKNKEGSELHYFVQKYINDVRWEDGFLSIDRLKKETFTLKRNLTSTPVSFYKKVVLNLRTVDFKVAIFAPAPIAGSGGHRTLFNLARKFSEAGCEVYCFLESEGVGIDVAYSYLKGSNVQVFVGWPDDLQLDMAVATIAHSTSFVASLKHVKHKAYLVQDFEAWFNPVGDVYVENENSYTHGLIHFTVGKFLTHLLRKQYNALAIPSGLGIDTSVYYDKNQKRENAISFLYQPEKFRRCPNLAIKALEIVKAKRPDVKIYIYGSDAPIALNFEVENLGLVHNLEELNMLYNKTKVGLCISITNPSRIPFEFMASGVVPVDIYRYNNLIDYPDGTIMLAYQSAESIAEAILHLFENESEWQERSQKCKKFVSTRTLDWEMDTFVNNALRVMTGREIEMISVDMSYTDKPYIATKDQKKEVEAFCNYQKKKAEK